MAFKQHSRATNRTADGSNSLRESSTFEDWDTELGKRISGPLAIVLMGASLALGGIASFTAFKNEQYVWSAVYFAFGASVALIDYWILRQNRDQD